MNRRLVYILLWFLPALLLACGHGIRLRVPAADGERLTGSAFYTWVAAKGGRERDSLALLQILRGNFPSFLQKFVPVQTQITDSLGKIHTATFYVMPDYISVGTDANWARVPLTPMVAQKIADSFYCFLPTRKLVNLVYEQAVVKLPPEPLFAFRDSSVTLWQHHLIIEGLRKGRKGLIAGIKKDVVLSAKISENPKPNRVAIYGWHRTNGQPIQPLYTGHVNSYVDYSHGARLVYRAIWVNGKKMDYTDVLQHPVLRRLICDEDNCNFFRYNTEQP
jgi:hypothetical protein